MEIKPGKYRCRDGVQAVVLEIFEGELYGRVRHRDGVWHSHRWNIDGKVYMNCVSALDLIAPWEEPKPRLRVWRRNSPGAIDHGTIKLLPEINGEPPEDWQPVPELDALFEKGKE